MLMKNRIILNDPIVKNNTIVTTLEVPNSIRKFFDMDRLYIKYRDIKDDRIEALSSSILVLPIISNIIYLAWLTSTDISVKELDKRFLDSMNKIKHVFKKFYPNTHFSEIHAEKIVTNNSSGNNVGLLFGGGIDSFSSYAKNRDEKPILIHITPDLGTINNSAFMNWHSYFENFCQEENVRMHIIETNIYDFLNRTRLNAMMMLKHKTDWLVGVGIGLNFLGACAPLSILEKMNKIYLPSPGVADRAHAFHESPSNINNIHWADVKCIHDIILSRQDKIQTFLSNFMSNRSFPIKLVSCNNSDRIYANCNKCEKCIRTILELMINDIDPNLVRFNIDKSIFKFIRREIEKKRLRLHKYQLDYWYDLQKNIRSKKNKKYLFGDDDFFKWLSNINISSMKRDSTYYITHSLRSYMFGFLPFQIRKAIRMKLFHHSIRSVRMRIAKIHHIFRIYQQDALPNGQSKK